MIENQVVTIERVKHLPIKIRERYLGLTDAQVIAKVFMQYCPKSSSDVYPKYIFSKLADALFESLPSSNLRERANLLLGYGVKWYENWNLFHDTMCMCNYLLKVRWYK